MPSWLYFLAEWVVPLGMIPVVARVHRPSVALAWVGFIFAVPWLGLPLYLLMGEYGLRSHLRRQRAIREVVGIRERIGEGEPPSRLTPVQEQLCRPVQRLGGYPALGGNRVELIEDGAAVDRLVADIDAARETVHLFFFIYNDDATGRRVAEALARASGRGVRCRVLADAHGSRPLFRALHRRMEERGIEVRKLLPVRWLRRPLARFDLRNHRKIAVIDGRTGYTGSLNVHDPDFDLDGRVWRQLTVRVAGPGVLPLQMLFVEDWFAESGCKLLGPEVFPDPLRPGGVTAQLVPSGPSDPEDTFQYALVDAIHAARERVRLTTPYFVPDQATLLALRLAAMRGVRVDVVVPERSDRRLVDRASRAYFQELLEAGVRVHLFGPDLVHTKALTIDDELTIIGTGNFDRRSFFLNFEVSVLFFDREVAAAAARIQDAYLGGAEPVCLRDWEQRPRRTRLLDGTLKLFSSLM